MAATSRGNVSQSVSVGHELTGAQLTEAFEWLAGVKMPTIADEWRELLQRYLGSLEFGDLELHAQRVRVLIRDVRLAGSTMARIAFEAENVSSTMTSLEPTLRLTGYDVPDRKKVSYQFTVPGNARQLSPHTPAQFVVGTTPLAGNPNRRRQGLD